MIKDKGTMNPNIRKFFSDPVKIKGTNKLFIPDFASCSDGVVRAWTKEIHCPRAKDGRVDLEVLYSLYTRVPIVMAPISEIIKVPHSMHTRKAEFLCAPNKDGIIQLAMPGDPGVDISTLLYYGFYPFKKEKMVRLIVKDDHFALTTEKMAVCFTLRK